MAARIESNAELPVASQPTQRHRLGVRIWHWLNTVAFVALLVSGIGIILYHPEFYWGEAGYFGLDAWLTLPIEPNPYQTSWGRNIHFLFAWVIVINAFFYIPLAKDLADARAAQAAARSRADCSARALPAARR